MGVILFLAGVGFGGVIGWGLATLRGQPRRPDTLAVAAVLDRMQRERRATTTILARRPVRR